MKYTIIKKMLLATGKNASVRGDEDDSSMFASSQKLSASRNYI